MIRRSTWILLGVFVILLAALVLFQRFSREEAVDPTLEAVAPVTSLEPVEMVFKIPPDAHIVGLKIEDMDGNWVEIYRSGEEQDWHLLDLTGTADQDAVNRVVNQVEDLQATQQLDPEIQADVIGLDDPTYRIHLEISNGGAYTLLIGDVTITNTSYYAKLVGGSPVVVSKFAVDSITNWLKNPPILLQPTGTVESSTDTGQ